MSMWNNGYERRSFEETQRQQACRYRAAGMTEEQIRAMYEYDLATFLEERKYREKCVGLDCANEKFPGMVVNPFENNAPVRQFLLSEFFPWINQIEKQNYLEAIDEMDWDQKRVIQLLVFENMSQREVAKVMHINQSCVSRKLEQIADILLRHGIGSEALQWGIDAVI